MEEVTWIELLSRQRDVVSRHRATTSTVTIGRAYDNDLVLDDPHVAAHHLRLCRDGDGAWFAEDLGSVNGISVKGVRHERVVLDGDITLQVGQVGVRVRTAGYAVAAEAPLARTQTYWPVALISLSLVFTLMLFQQWLGETGEPKLIGYLTPLLLFAILAAIWTSAWSVLSRIFTGSARYGLHLSIFSIGLLLYTLCAQASEVTAFALSWTALATYTYVVGWFAFAAICFAHLRALGRAQIPLKVICVIALAALGITTESLQQSDQRATSGQSVTLRRLEPPVLRIAHAQAQTTFFTSAANLRNTLDKAREKAPSGNESGNDE